MTPISVNYTDQELRILVEEFIVIQRSSFTFKGLCSYILYRAMEEERTVGNALYQSDQMTQHDCDRVCAILEKIIREGRIEKNEALFIKK